MALVLSMIRRQVGGLAELPRLLERGGLLWRAPKHPSQSLSRRPMPGEAVRWSAGGAWLEVEGMAQRAESPLKRSQFLPL